MRKDDLKSSAPFIAGAVLCALAAGSVAAQVDASFEERIAALEQARDTAGRVTAAGVLAYAYQHESTPGDPTGWSLPFQPELSILPSARDEVFFKFGFAAGDGLNAVTNFALAPWAADLAGDVLNLGDATRHHLLTAWYRRRFTLGEDHELALSGGILDATDYLDHNAYSNDEYTQFMNAALVNAPNAFLPSYEPGAAFEWRRDRISVHGVFLQAGPNACGHEFTYTALQLQATFDPGPGPGHYRVIGGRTSDSFEDPTGTDLEPRAIFLISCDQPLSEAVGVWVRAGRQATDARVDHDALLSGGLQLEGALWGRHRDALGIGYAHLGGAEQTGASLSRSSVFETYLRVGLSDLVAVTLDVQHLEDAFVASAADADVTGWIVGTRVTVLY